MSRYGYYQGSGSLDVTFDSSIIKQEEEKDHGRGDDDDDDDVDKEEVDPYDETLALVYYTPDLKEDGDDQRIHIHLHFQHTSLSKSPIRFEAATVVCPRSFTVDRLRDFIQHVVQPRGDPVEWWMEARIRVS
jgi:hypothetical protein